MSRSTTCFALAACLALALNAQAEPDVRNIGRSGNITAVTVYRGQALVTRSVSVDGAAGAVEVIIGPLPDQVVPDSLYAGGEGPIRIQAVRYRSRAVREEPRDEVRELTQQIEEVQKEIRANDTRQSVIKQQQKYLDQLEQFTATRNAQEMEKGSLDAGTVVQVTEFLFQQRSRTAQEMLDLQEAARELKDDLELLQRKRSQLASRLSKTVREAILTMDKTGGGEATVRLSYLVSNATWSPSYNLRAANANDNVALEYNAQLRQMSGEDWTGAKLTLSTATPNMTAGAPVLTPFWITLGQPGAANQPVGVRGTYDVSEQQFKMQKNMMEALRQREQRAQAQKPTPDDALQGYNADWDVNEWAGRYQILDLLAGREALVGGGRPAEDALSVSYELKDRIDVPSRSDRQTVEIATLELPAEFYYLATPLLTPYVYRQAEVNNTSELALLAGPFSAYLDGQFKGKGNLPMVARGQQFTVGFGVDSQLRADRELVDKTETVQGANRIQTFEYRLVLENYKDRPVNVRLMDRLPEPKGADVEVKLVDTSMELSDDKVYQRTLRKNGILMWEIEVPAKAAGASAHVVTYAYSMEFAKDKRPAEPSPAAIEHEKLRFNKALEDYMQN